MNPAIGPFSGIQVYLSLKPIRNRALVPVANQLIDQVVEEQEGMGMDILRVVLVYYGGVFRTARAAFPLSNCDSHARLGGGGANLEGNGRDRKSTRLNSSHLGISYAVFCLKKKNNST